MLLTHPDLHLPWFFTLAMDGQLLPHFLRASKNNGIFKVVLTISSTSSELCHNE